MHILDKLAKKYNATLTTDDLGKKPRTDKICKVSWCSSVVDKDEHHATCYCTVHKQFRRYGSNAPTRPWLFYKVERVANGELKCECCGYDPKESYPDRDLKTLTALLDVDHIDSNLKGTEEGEQPSNYQLLCKHCHILKSIDEGDYLRKIDR